MVAVEQVAVQLDVGVARHLHGRVGGVWGGGCGCDGGEEGAGGEGGEGEGAGGVGFWVGGLGDEDEVWVGGLGPVGG